MAEICCGAASGSDTAASCEPSSRAARRRRMEIRRFKFIAGVAVPSENGNKRPKLEVYPDLSLRECENAVENCGGVAEVPERRLDLEVEDDSPEANDLPNGSPVCLTSSPCRSLAPVHVQPVLFDPCPKYGMTSVCGRRRDMEDAVAIHPSFCPRDSLQPSGLHFFGVYDGHGCSHVAKSCKERLHQLVKEEVENRETPTEEWKEAMERSFSRMDKEVSEWSTDIPITNCRCELQTPQCDAVGSTAVVAIITADKIIVANCGDSRAVLSRGGKAVPLSTDHKPDRPDELSRIQGAGGRVIYWDGARVLGVLAMSRAIGDNYLKPYVISEPEVTITDRTEEDECLILASDGLWDVVSNDTACSIARKCIDGQAPSSPPPSPGNSGDAVKVGIAGETSDKACSDASVLLTKVALARHSTDNVSVVVIDLKKDT
ncbi:probable protein phosphatase 2C 24 [Telopea speciosissima]|uniref:probable protein phosphatase 2C 24 n=1 Tax=Telopea speciosissima TaxID=54955 RepID=UPI001CC7783B|nr:probable protein phosphatase 2C 24 [Telopea speciosissima]